MSQSLLNLEKSQISDSGRSSQKSYWLLLLLLLEASTRSNGTAAVRCGAVRGAPPFVQRQLVDQQEEHHRICLGCFFTAAYQDLKVPNPLGLGNPTPDKHLGFQTPDLHLVIPSRAFGMEIALVSLQEKRAQHVL